MNPYRTSPRLASLLFAAAAALAAEPLLADILVTQRESFASITVFAGSGPGVDSYGNSESLDTLTGSFTFDDDYEAFVDNGTGTAYAFGSLFAIDSLFQSADLIDITMGRIASGQRNAISGTALTDSRQRQTMRVRFQITEPVRYDLSGFFDEGLDNGVSKVRLRNVVSGRSVFNFDSSTVLSETGILEPGNNGIRTYELVVDMLDALDPQQSDASSMNLSFSVSTVPEPSAAGLMAVIGLSLAGGRRRRSRLNTLAQR